MARKLTAGSGAAGAFAGETVTRRRFMTGSAGVAGVIASAAVALPALGFAIGPVFDRELRPRRPPARDHPRDRVLVALDGVACEGRPSLAWRHVSAG